jgi:5-(aminomethyl)-3-furanmethanol phosphate kinase
MSTPLVVKVGGSLFDLPNLGARLTEFLKSCSGSRVLLVPGGGAAADVVRDWDKRHRLKEERSHWLALRMLQVNAAFLETLLPAAHVVASPSNPLPLGILDAFQFACADEASPDHLPHSWDVTSDSMAVRVAAVARAKELALLKSRDWQGTDWEAAARAGLVDRHFPRAIKQAADLQVRVVNLR